MVAVVKKKLGGFGAALAAIAAAIIAARGGGSHPPKPVEPPPPPRYTLVVHVCDRTCDRDANGEDHKVPRAAVSIDHGALAVVATPEGDAEFHNLTAGSYTVCAKADGYKEQCDEQHRVPADGDVSLGLERDVPPVAKLAIEGRFFVPRLTLAMAGSILADDDTGRDAVLDEAHALGFNGVRAFGGALAWAGLTAQQSEQRLPALFEAARARGLYVYVDALTDSGYNAEAHLATVAQQCAAAVNCLMAAANEIGHPTLVDLARDPARLLAAARRLIPPGVVWTLGAPLGQDEVDADGKYPGAGGLFNDGHLDRGRDKWNQVRRLREIYGLAETFKVPALSGEPIGADEQSMPGKRESDPAVFFAMGALCRGFDLGCVFHSEDGLHGRTLRPNQRACAEAFLAGWKAIDTDARLTFQNTGWSGAPVKSFSGAVRVYSFVGEKNYAVIVGAENPRVETANGWALGERIAERPGIQIVRLTR